MTARTFAAVCGLLYLALGAAGFVPAVWERPGAGPTLSVRVFHASLFGVFATNLVLTMVHVVIGLWGAMAANNRYSALVFTRASTVLFLLMAIAGFIPVDVVRTVYGLAPLHGNNAWLYLVTAAIGAFFSFRPGYHLTQIGVHETMNPHLPHR